MTISHDFTVRKSLILALAIVLGAGICAEAAKSKARAKVNPAQKTSNFQQLFLSLFNEWDRNQDGLLDLKELNVAIENPSVRGTDAAVAVFLHRHLQVDDEERDTGLTRAEVLAMASNPEFQKTVSGKASHIEKIDHTLFAPGDPNLESFHQGGIGDCYLLAVIGSFVYHHPQTVRTMITPQADGKFQINFATGKIVTVPPLTDAELTMGAGEGRNHGVWLSVLEKAYAEIDREAKERKTGAEIADEDAVPTDFIGHGGYYGPVIKLLSGHKTSSAAFPRWFKENPSDGLQHANDLLTKLARGNKLMAVCVTGDKSRPMPKGIVHGHIYGVLNYSPATRLVTVFNPWGNHINPAGPPGLRNGYPTEHGIFQVPLNEFVQIFAGFTYETDQPVIASR